MNAAIIRPVDPADQTQSPSDLFLVFVGTALGAVPGVWLEQYTSFMVILGALLIPVGGILIAHYYLRNVDMSEAFVAELYGTGGPFRRVLLPGMAAWAAGAAAYVLAGSAGGTIPALAVSVLVYWVGSRVL